MSMIKVRPVSERRDSDVMVLTRDVEMELVNGGVRWDLTRSEALDLHAQLEDALDYR
jgi:hypothetical protein